MSRPDHDEFDDGDCWQCGGEGYVYNCQDEIGCVDPEGGCDFCMRRCDVCNPRKPKPHTGDDVSRSPATERNDG